ncbi:hypothetical protein BHU72_05385 [Desulfuribacillus stibiiarsenatis]|uniref:Copper resistance protein CopZ n=1 Tax=Desulfuribacillus stibiiarsenatis TaxID=1390249 RepID=A0A1E5L4Q6_9FIRM|nr:copper chaperone PCu(A)C [Desulfuribacillus stibiiarsenatis]OEH85044.1 hypothetical protein BHU72_05385 [Desulfuribacillus stibiiarsenatis]
MRKILIMAVLLSMFIFTTGCSSDKAPDIVIENISIAPSSMKGEGVYSGYFTIRNNGGEDTFTGFMIPEFPEATFELHNVKDGSMYQIEHVNIPNGEIEFKKGGYHIMMFNMPSFRQLPDVFTIVFEFDKSGSITVPNVLKPEGVIVPTESSMKK